MKYEIKNIIIPLDENSENENLLKYLKKQYCIDINDIKKTSLIKRSIDSRSKSNIKLLYNIEVDTDLELNTEKYINIKRVELFDKVKRYPVEINKKIAIIGMGPAGIFAALRLVEYGFLPTIYERGECVEERTQKIDRFWTKAILDTESNVQFGEGGAGTFSDGKLTTRIRSEYIETVFDTLVKYGAPKEILYDFKPHIGTDVLKKVIVNIRKYLIQKGVEINFNSKLTNLVLKNDKIEAIEINEKQINEVDYVIIGIGHSARDTYKMLHKKGIYMENKDFAVGFRIEHPRQLIDEMQYGKFAGHPKLGSASYSFTYNDKVSKKGVFSFCMCPGDEIINAASTKFTSLTNGMSYHSRNGEYSNAAIVCSVTPADYGKNLFDGMNFQENLEKKSYQIANNYTGLSQTLFDYLSNKVSKNKINTSYKLPTYNCNLNDVLPDFINKNIKNAFDSWKRNKHFVSKQANIIGLETRTSAPIRILRDLNGISVNVKNLMPIGEGAGYAGGIVSAAIDGIRVVDKNFTRE